MNESDGNSGAMLQGILQTNSRAVQLLTDGNHAWAREVFNIALEQTTEIVHKLRVELPESMSAEPSSPRPSIRWVPIRDSSSAPTMGTESYIYGYAATVEDPRNPDSLTCDYQYSVLLTTILMYNLGLTHHWRSDAQGDSSLPIKALTLYQMAYSLLQRSSSLFHKNEPFILGILNNMGAIYHTIGEYDKAHNCFQALKHLCIINRGVLNVGYEAHSGIMLNIIFLSHAPHTAAAA